ncbi:MAG: hypothetical protein K5795_07855 [Lachnospiraceae bacterium]|nr:hypothetical protein [Lachnospiraceae bacterium]
MGLNSIIDLKEPVKGLTEPVFFLDLNIDQILERVTGGNRKIRAFYEYFPLDKECTLYRRMIYRDIREKGLFKVFSEFEERYTEFRELERKKKETRVSVQRPVWNIYAIKLYTETLMKLLKELEETGPESEGIRALKEYLAHTVGEKAFCEMHDKSVELTKELEGLNVTATYEKGRVQVDIKDKDLNEDVDEDDENYKNYHIYEEFLDTFDAENPKEFVNPFETVEELTSFEQEVVKIVSKRNPEWMKKTEKLYEDCSNFEDESFFRLYEELPYYLSFYSFEESMKKRGMIFCEPEEDEAKYISAEGLYDLALACVNYEKGKPVVSNDFYYSDKDLFFVLTGPNQGGKTTFARSLGQLMYFSKMGLDVPAVKANVHYYTDLLTHFSVEESVETGRGKLMEELVRLSPMMKYAKDNAFVVINELFTTAANYDAIIMGKNVLDHFVNQNCHGIYVTHLSELCDTDSHVAGLSAQLDENGIQNFKILRKSVAYEGCAENQIKKYKLDYSSLQGRLKEIMDRA